MNGVSIQDKEYSKVQRIHTKECTFISFKRHRYDSNPELNVLDFNIILLFYINL